MRFIASFALWLILPTALMASDAGVVEKLRQDVVGKTFTLATDVAGNTCLYTGNLNFPTSRLVDTEISEVSGPRYFLRADRFMNTRHCENPAGRIEVTLVSGDYIESGMITHMHGSGSSVIVKQVEAKSDRIELQLTTDGASSGDDSYAKLKLMLGKGYESQSLEQIEMVLARALILPRLDQIQAERESLEELKSSISSLERELAADRSAERRIDESTRLLAQYQEQASTQKRLNTVAFEPVSVDQSTSRIAELNAIISEGQRQVAIDRIQKASEIYASSTLLMKASCERINNSPARSSAELNDAVATVETAKQNMETFYKAQREMEVLGQGISTENKEFYARCLAASDAVARTFDAQRESILQSEAVAAEQQRKSDAEAAEKQQQAEAEAAERQRQAEQRRIEEERSLVE